MEVLSIFQRYKMKANHNCCWFFKWCELGAFNISKIQDESKSQLHETIIALKQRCFQYFKDTRWKQITTRTWYNHFNIRVLSIFQRYKMKANHNGKSGIAIKTLGAFNISKIQDESKSQLERQHRAQDLRCFQYFKDTRWKQITTWWAAGYPNQKVLSIFQRYKMKANHNAFYLPIWKGLGAFNISKIQDESKSQRWNIL